MKKEIVTEPGLDILIVEDDALLCETIRLNWPNASDRLKFLSNYRQSLRYLHSGEIAFFDSVILDIHLPDGDGISILRELRSNTDLPIVLISGVGTGNSRADAIDLGADDYVMKPFHLRELQARVSRAVKVRRATQMADQREEFELANGTTCMLDQRMIVQHGHVVPLTDAEVRLLAYLHRNRGQSCSKQALYKIVFYRAYDQSDKTLDVYISRIRKKLSSFDIDNPDDIIQTVRGYGYRLRTAIG